MIHRFVMLGLRAGLVALLAPGCLGAQGATRSLDRADIDIGAFAQYERMTRSAGARIEQALLLDKDDEDGRRPLLEEAELQARAAVRLLPSEAHGWFLVAASVGMLSELESTRRQVQMAAEVWAAADSALVRDPDHGGAHHILGRLNYEAMRASGFARLVATHLFGSTLMQRTSWEQAEQHFRRAAEVEPDVAVHRIWLGRLHEERGDRDAARRLYESVVADRAETALERRWRDEAAELLDDL